MPKRIPIKIAKDVALATGCQQVILLAFDGELTHVVTYGKTVEDCAQAAAGANILKKKWGWPEGTMAESASVKRLKAKVKDLEERLQQYQERGL